MARDFAIAGALCLFASLFVIYLLRTGTDAVPRHNVYYGSDTDRVLANIIDRNSNYTRLSVHPLFGLVGLGIDELFQSARSMPLFIWKWSLAQANSFAIIMYSAARLWKCSSLISAVITLLGIGASSFVYWVTITDTHFMGGLSVLVLAILSAITIHSRVGKILRSGFALTIGFSIVITNSMAWALSQLTLSARAGIGVREFVANHWKRKWDYACGLLVGLGIILICLTAEYHLLRNPSIPGPFQGLVTERHFLGADDSSFYSFLAALTVVTPENRMWPFGALSMAGALIWALSRMRRDAAFIALFGLFGLVLHSVYDPGHAFLFSPNYVPAAILAVGIAVQNVNYRRTAIVALSVVALTLTVVNTMGYVAKRRAVAPQSDEPIFYGQFMKPHPVPASQVVRPADPPIGSDQ